MMPPTSPKRPCCTERRSVGSRTSVGATSAAYCDSKIEPFESCGLLTERDPFEGWTLISLHAERRTPCFDISYEHWGIEHVVADSILAEGSAIGRGQRRGDARPGTAEIDDIVARQHSIDLGFPREVIGATTPLEVCMEKIALD